MKIIAKKDYLTILLLISSANIYCDRVQEDFIMKLKFPYNWIDSPPHSTEFETAKISRNALNDFLKLIMRTAMQGDQKIYLEHFKKFFCLSNGDAYYPSSNVSWAQSDLESQMETASDNAPFFIETFYSACISLKERDNGIYVPDYKSINKILKKNNIGYEIINGDFPKLVLRGAEKVILDGPYETPSLSERAREVLQESLKKSDEFLEKGEGKSAVQESLWLLETIATAFKGLDTGVGTIEGKYFNEIVRELKKSSHRGTFKEIAGWIQKLHGFLSSPSGGGIRHGLDLKDGLEINNSEARLFCNLIRSYIFYLISEHERLRTNRD